MTVTKLAPFGPDFADVAPLQVAGEDDPGIAGQFLAIMDVAERPVVVAVRFQARQVAGRVAGVRGIPLGGGVQQADVEQARDRWRIGPGQVILFGLVGEALAVDGDPDRIEAAGVGLGMAEDGDVFGQAQRAGNAVGGVMVAADGEDRDGRLGQPAHLGGEEQAGAEVRPVAVVNVARDQQEIDFFLDGEIDEAAEGAARGATDQLGGGRWIGLQPSQRAVEVKVGGVQEPEVGHRACLSQRRRFGSAWRRRPGGAVCRRVATSFGKLGMASLPNRLPGLNFCLGETADMLRSRWRRSPPTRSRRARRRSTATMRFRWICGRRWGRWACWG